VLVRWVLLRVIGLVPATRMFGVKRVLLRMCGFEVASDVRVVSTAKFNVPRLSIGAGAWIGHEVMFVGGDADIRIGRNVDIGPRVTLATGSHQIGDSSHRAGRGYSTDIVIEDGCWIGASATVLGGAVVGHGSVVGAGSLVKGTIPADSIAVGVPTRVVRRLEE